MINGLLLYQNREHAWLWFELFYSITFNLESPIEVKKKKITLMVKESQGKPKMKEADWRFKHRDGDVLQSGRARFSCKRGLCLRSAFLTSTHYVTPGEAH